MQLHTIVQDLFEQLNLAIRAITPAQYSNPLPVLSNASIGQHCRHIIEMFQCLEKGYSTGLVNYEERPRALAIEQDPTYASSLLETILGEIQKADKPVLIEGMYHPQQDQSMQFQSSYHREILYNLEHAIHHMALIRIGLSHFESVQLSPSFGVAPATLKNQQACAQ
jgi:hypothetical protein